MIRRICLVLLVVAAIVSAGSMEGHAQSLSTRHLPEAIRNGQARSRGRLPATQVMQLVIVLPLRDQAGLDAFLHDLYDPASSSYRQFLTVPEFTERFGPNQENYDAVIRFAEANGLTVVGTSRNRMNVQVKGAVENIEKAFHVTMGVYQHPTENRTFYSPDREPRRRLAVRAVAHLGPGQLFHPASRRPA